MKTLFVIFFHLCILIANDLKSQNPDFSILIGNWTCQKSNGVNTEKWSFNDSTQIDGKAHRLVNGEFIETEILMLKKIGNKWCYVAYPKNQSPVLFNYNSEQSTSNHWIFSNIEHDFPKHIAYKFIDINHLEVFIYNSDPVEESMKFFFERQD